LSEPPSNISFAEGRHAPMTFEPALAGVCAPAGTGSRQPPGTDAVDGTGQYPTSPPQNAWWLCTASASAPSKAMPTDTGTASRKTRSEIQHAPLSCEPAFTGVCGPAGTGSRQAPRTHAVDAEHQRPGDPPWDARWHSKASSSASVVMGSAETEERGELPGAGDSPRSAYPRSDSPNSPDYPRSSSPEVRKSDAFPCQDNLMLLQPAGSCSRGSGHAYTAQFTGLAQHGPSLPTDSLGPARGAPEDSLQQMQRMLSETWRRQQLGQMPPPGVSEQPLPVGCVAPQRSKGSGLAALLPHGAPSGSPMPSSESSSKTADGDYAWLGRVVAALEDEGTGLRPGAPPLPPRAVVECNFWKWRQTDLAALPPATHDLLGRSHGFAVVGQRLADDEELPPWPHEMA
jgi:hypothetical protein